MSELNITPDGVRYLDRVNLPSPFHLRWLIPWLCRDESTRWTAAAWFGFAGLVFGTWALAGGWAGIAAAALVAVLPSVRFGLTHRVLVDLPALGLATLSAAAMVHGWTAAALVLVVLAGLSKESAPIFAALFAWHPVLLLGMVAPMMVDALRVRGEDRLGEHHAWILAHPVQASRQYHPGWWSSFDPRLVFPWGACVVALAAPSWQLAAVLIVAYAQVLVATDTVRLYQWAAPVVALAAVSAVPWQWWPVLIVVTAFNPMRGDGI